jgi:hypothetical protein
MLGLRKRGVNLSFQFIAVDKIFTPGKLDRDSGLSQASLSKEVRL